MRERWRMNEWGAAHRPRQSASPLLLLLTLTLAAVAVSSCGSGSPAAPAPGLPAGSPLPIMGAARLAPQQIVAWFKGRQPAPAGTYTATVPVETMAELFIQEGAAEGVTGDIAFIQSVVETGWFRFNGTIPPSFNNFAGIGATDSNPTPAVFPDARIGVRAQIQHLRAYADPGALTCTVPPLNKPCVDPRFHLVQPKGRAATWNQMGNGNWASAPTYAGSIVSLYEEAKAFNNLR